MQSHSRTALASHSLSRTVLSLLLLPVLAGACAGGRRHPTPEATVTSSPTSPPPQVVTTEELKRNPTQTPEQALMGRFPGVQVSYTGDGSIAIRIRGTTSLLGDNEPLYVVDGVPISAGAGGSLRGINPNDIASIQVLKDAASTSMYGSRGANGVILIRTKKPGQ